MKKGTVTLCAIMKNEAPYVLEWIAYHKCLGFDRIVVYDNSSTDGTSEILSGLAAAGEIAFIHWPDIPYRAPQKRAYFHAVCHAETEWICFLDADEFLNLHQDNSIFEFLRRFGEDVSAVAINWSMFGSNGHESQTSGLLIERFTRAATLQSGLNRPVKSISRASRVKWQSAHRSELFFGSYVNVLGRPVTWISPCAVAPSVHKIAEVNHYAVKSLQEYKTKIARGRAAKSASKPGKFRDFQDYLQKYDRNERLDESILRRLAEVRLEVDRLSLIGAAAVTRGSSARHTLTYLRMQFLYCKRRLVFWLNDRRSLRPAAEGDQKMDTGDKIALREP